MNDGLNKAGPGCDDYETPPWLFKALDSEFGLTCDAAASRDNALCASWTGDIDGWMANLTPDDPRWRYFCNPPYSDIYKFVRHALGGGELWVKLLPVRTDTDWFHMLVESGRCEFRYFRKRIRFYLGSKPTDSPRFASMVVIVRPK